MKASGRAALPLVLAGLACASSAAIRAAEPEPAAGSPGSAAVHEATVAPSSIVAPGTEPTAEPPAALESGELFVNANNAYETGDYAAAVQLYEELLERGNRSGAILYNLGNAYLRSGELGRAIAAYRRCLVLEPRNQDARANLAFARQSARDALEPPSPAAIRQTLFFWHYGLSRPERIRLGALLNLVLFGLLAARLWRRRSELLRWSSLAAAVLLVLVIGSLFASLGPRRVAVVVPQEIDVYSGTDQASVVRFKLHAGTEVRSPAEREGWLRIGLPDGQQGWIEREHAEFVLER